MSVNPSPGPSPQAGRGESIPRNEDGEADMTGHVPTILERYPILARLPEELRAGFAAKADAGLALTPDEGVLLGLCRCEGRVLMPAYGPLANLFTLFGGDTDAIRDVVRRVVA